MRIVEDLIVLDSKQRFQFFDITDKIEELISKKNLINGLLLIYSKHTTLAIRVNEKESGIFHDAEQFLSETLPKNKYYRHNDFDIRTENLVCDGECVNGDSHIKHFLLGASETVPIKDGKLQFGTWQKILAIELDGPRKGRVILVKFIGE
ncbi:YjbQ family protein [bacterium]|nr:YjbQ family protein [bacterium]